MFAALLDRACPVAVKVLRPGGGGTHPSRQGTVATKQFRREVRRYTALTGVPGVARFYGVSSADSPVDLLVTERLRGGSLREVLKNGGLDVCGALRVAHVIANALAGIHKRGFSHGDVKPANVLFGERVVGVLGERVDVRLVDFGLSRTFRDGEVEEEEEEEEVLTAQSLPVMEDERMKSLIGPLDALGTPAYLSPEAWEGAKALRNKDVAQMADVYALGMIMYELDAGSTPWAEQSECGIFCSIVNHNSRPQWPKREELVEGYRALVEKCWAKDYRERPTSAEVADRLLDLKATHGHKVVSEVIGSTESSPRLGGETLPFLDFIPNWNAFGENREETGRKVRNLKFEGKEESGDNVNTFSTKDPMGGSLQANLSDERNDDIVSDGKNGNTEDGIQNVHLICLDEVGNDAQEESISKSESVQVVERGVATSLMAPSTDNREFRTGFSVDDASTSGGYEVDGLSQANLHNSDQTIGSLKSSSGNEPRNGEELERRSQNDFREFVGMSGQAQAERDLLHERTEVPIVIPEFVHNLQYPFKEEVMKNNCHALCRALMDSEWDPAQASRALEAVGVLLAKSTENCEHFVDCGALRTMSCILSRYGSKDARLSKAACIVVANMAMCNSDPAERELRTTGVCEIVTNAIRFHPANLPVMQNAADALVKLCRASSALCSIILALGGVNSALRVVARGSNSFHRDVLVASDGLEILSILAESHPSAVANTEVIGKVLGTCNRYREKKIDEECLTILRCITRQARGQEVVLSVIGSMSVLSGLIDRLTGTGSSYHELKMICDMMSGLARVSRKSLARDAFLASDAVESVVQAVRSCANSSTDDSMVCEADRVGMAIAALNCFSSMTGLGRDVCGALQMAQVFHVTRDVVSSYAANRSLALSGVLFVENILKELRSSSFGAHLDVVIEMLMQLEMRWRGDATVLYHVEEAQKLLRQISDREGNEEGSDEAADPNDSPQSTLRIFSRKKAARNR